MTTEVLDAEPVTQVPAPLSKAEEAKLILRTTALAELDVVASGIAALTEAYGGKVYDVKTTEGMDAAKKARADIRDRRYQVPHIIKKQKAAIKMITEDLDSQGEQIVTALQALETPIDKQIKDEEERRAAEKARKAEEERLRIAAHVERIAGLREFVGLAMECRTAARVQELRDKLEADTLEGLEEFEPEARQVQESALQRIDAILADKQAAEAERARMQAEQEEAQRQIAAQQAELARQRAEQEERERAAAAQRQAEEEEARARREEQEAELRRQREAFEAEQAQFRAAQAAEAERLAAAAAEVARQQEELAKASAPAPAPAAEAQPVVTTEAAPVADAATCCEKAQDQGVQVCEECAEISAGYQAAMGPSAAQEEAADLPEPTLKLGTINARFEPYFSVTAAGLAAMGFEPAKTEGRAVLFHESTYFAICEAVAKAALNARNFTAA